MSAPALPRNHGEYEALAVAWAINALEPADQAIFEAHRAGCADCIQIARETLDVAAELAYGVPDVPPPPSLRRRLLTDVTATAQLRTTPAAGTSPVPARETMEGRPLSHDVATTARQAGTDHSTPATRRQAGTERSTPATRRRPGTDHSDPTTPRQPGTDHSHPTTPRQPGTDHGLPATPRQTGAGLGRPAGAERPSGTRWLRSRRRVLAALVAAVLVGGSAVTTWQIARSDQAPSDRVAALSSGAGTVATVVVHQRGADVVTDALPPNDGTAYYVWGVPAGGDPQVVGTFLVTTTGLHSYPLRLKRSLSGYPVLAVSEEPAGSTPTAPSSVIGKGSLSGG